MQHGLHHEGRKNMKKMQKKSVLSLTAAVLSAALIPSNLMPASAWEQVSGEEYINWKQGSCVPHVLDTFLAKINAFGLEKCDFDGDHKAGETEDFYALESKINALYQESGYQPGQEIAGYPEYDINRDGYATPEDYCILLQYVQRNFDFTLNYGEMYATVTAYTGKNAAHVSVPREVFAKGRIFPVMEIADGAFSGHAELESVSFDNYEQPVWCTRNTDGEHALPYQLIPTAGTVTAGTFLYFGSGVFDGCTQLGAIALPSHIRFADTDPFRGAPYLQDNFQEVDGIRYLYDNTASVFAALDLTPEKKQEIGSTHQLSFSKKTTTVCSNLTKQLDPESVQDVYIPASVEFIEDYAFANFKQLSTVCGDSYAESSPEQQQLVKRYLCAFDNTKFIADEVNARLDDCAAEIFAVCNPRTEQKAAVVQVGKLIARLSDYRGYYSLDKQDGTKDPGPDNIQTFTPGFDLYPNDAYYYNDLCRGSICSAGAVFLLGDENTPAYTECVGFAHASALLLNRIGVQNLYCGMSDHALNAVYVDKQWHSFDMAGNSLVNPDALNAGNLLGDLAAGMSVSNSRQFELFPHSANNQLTAWFMNDIDLTNGKRPATLTLNTKEVLSDAETGALGRTNIVCNREEIPVGWHELSEGYFYYMGADGRFLRSTYAPAPDADCWINASGWWDHPET